MRVLLLHPELDTDREAPLPDDHADLTRDLDLGPLWDAMAGGDQLLRTVAEHTMLSPLADPAGIGWRLDVLADGLRDPTVIEELYALAGRGLESPRGSWLYSGRTADSLLGRSIQILGAALPTLHALRGFAERRIGTVRSPGLRGLCRRLLDELGEDYLAEVAGQLRLLGFPGGMVFTARFGDGGLSSGLSLRRPPTPPHGWRRLFSYRPPERLHYTLADRDEAGSRALEALRDDAALQVAEALATASDHVLGFFHQLRWEAGFYLGCLRLRDALAACRVSLSLPEPLPSRPLVLTATGLTDPALALRAHSPVVPSDLAADSASLIVVTGANQGGKSTFLRGLGLAQLMMQAGMFVPAASYRASVAGRLHTHFRREEDAGLDSGKLDEELVRMSGIVDRVRPTDLVLFNESFASTDEREGSEIARQVVDSLTHAGIRVVFVTHLHTLAAGYTGREGTLFLRPERLDDGSRTFRILPGYPLPTSHAEDVWRQVFEGAR